LLGSVSRKVLHHATCPVAVIRVDPLHREAPIVVGSTARSPSQRALEWAVEHARNGRLGLTAVRAWQPLSTTYEFIGPVPCAFDLAADVRRDVQRQLDGVDAAGLVASVQVCIVQDRASAALLDAGSHASMLVVGSRGHGQLAGMLLGSVSDQVSRHATCPVIVVP